MKSHDFEYEIENRFDNMNLANSDVSDEFFNTPMMTRQGSAMSDSDSVSIR